MGMSYGIINFISKIIKTAVDEQYRKTCECNKPFTSFCSDGATGSCPSEVIGVITMLT